MSAFDENWTEELRAELAENQGRNGRVGSRVVFEDDRMRVWLLELQPGERLPFHTHVQDYFWTATRAGTARSHYADGRTEVMHYEVGTTRAFRFEKGQSMTHDLENIGEGLLSFTTVEFFGSANPPLF